MTDTTADVPLACMLDAEAWRRRLERIADLHRATEANNNVCG